MGQTCVTGPALVSRAAIATPNPKIFPNSTSLSSRSYTALTPTPQPYPRTNPNSNPSLSHTRLQPNPISKPNSTSLPLPSQIHFTPNTLQLQPILIPNISLIPSANQLKLSQIPPPNYPKSHLKPSPVPPPITNLSSP